MTTSVYVLGGAGVGKSTFTAALLAGRTFGPVEVIHDAKMGVSQRPNPMHGQRLSDGGLYLGINRAGQFPGSDGLSRTCGTSGATWLALGALPPYIVSEGATLGTPRFLGALDAHTDLTVVYMTASEEVRAERLARRGAGQAASFVAATATRAAGVAAHLVETGARVLPLDAGDPAAWDLVLDLIGARLLRATG